MKSLAWLEPWEPVEQSDPLFVAELARELPSSHPLFGKPAHLIARGKDDDALFAIEDAGQVAAVHLTWSGRSECPPWPNTEIFASLDDFAALRMRSDHAALFGPDTLAAPSPPTQAAVRGPRHGIFWTVLASLVASMAALMWQCRDALRGGDYSIKLVILATAFVVVLLLTPIALRVARRLSG